MACFLNIKKQNQKNKDLLNRQFTNPINDIELQFQAHPLNSNYRICTQIKQPETIPIPQNSYVERINQDSKIRLLDQKLEHPCPKETEITREVFTTTTCEFPNVPVPAHLLYSQQGSLWNNATKRRYIN